MRIFLSLFLPLHHPCLARGRQSQGPLKKTQEKDTDWGLHGARFGVPEDEEFELGPGVERIVSNN